MLFRSLCSDMLIKGEDADNVILGDTFTADGFERTSDSNKWTYTMEVYFCEIPAFIKDLPLHARECDNWRYLLSVETTGKFMTYQWYRNGLPIPGATKNSYYALAKDSSAFFRVSVKNPCGDSIVSNQCYLSFCDEKIDGINRLIELIVPPSAETNPRPGQLIFVKSQQDFTFTIKAKNGYSLKYATVTTDSPIWNEQGGIKRTILSDSVMEAH